MKNLKKKIQKKSADAKGFTLIELVVVIIIIGILSAIAVPSYTAYVDRGHKAADLTGLDAILTAVDATFADTEYDIVAVEVDIDPDTNTFIDIVAYADFDHYWYVYSGEYYGYDYDNYWEDSDYDRFAYDFAYYYTGDDSAADTESVSELIASALPTLTSDYFLTDDLEDEWIMIMMVDGYEYMNDEDTNDNLYYIYEILGYYEES